MLTAGRRGRDYKYRPGRPRSVSRPAI